MDSSIQLLLNEQLVTVTADQTTVKLLTEDDHYLADYINRAAKAGQFHFLFAKDPTTRRIVVKRIPPPPPPQPNNSIPVWCNRKGRPSDTDNSATLLLLRLRNSQKYAPRFADGHLKSKLWEEIAGEMLLAGYDVDGPKCAQKCQTLSQNFQRNDCQCFVSSEICAELRKLFGEKKGEADEDDEEWLPKLMKKRKRCEEEASEGDDFFKKFLKKNGELKEERFREICGLIRRRNEILEEKLKLNREIIAILKTLTRPS